MEWIPVETRLMRVQRKRTKGFKMPENTVYVGRPTKWGNPFVAHSYCDFCDGAGWYEGGETLQTTCQHCNGTGDGLQQSLNKYKMFIETRIAVGDLNPSELKGKNLACWCRLDQPCHADVLLRIANPPPNT